MHCNDYLQLLSGHLDHTNSEKEEKRLQGHLKSCKRCRELLAQMEANDILLNDEAIVPPADLTGRIMQQVSKEPRKRRSYRRIISYTAAGLATAAMLTLVLTGHIPSMSKSTAADETANALPYAGTALTAAEENRAAPTDGALETPNEKDTLFGATECSPAPSTDAQTIDDGAPDDTVVFAAPDDLGDEKPKEGSEDNNSGTPPTEAPTAEMTSEAAPPETLPATEPVTAASTEAPTAPATEPNDSLLPPMYTCALPPAGSPEPLDPTLADPSGNRLPPNKRDLKPSEELSVFPDGPVVVLWDADAASLTSYSGLESVEIKQLPTANDELLFPRFMLSLPLAEKSLLNNSLLPSETGFAVMAYRTSYTTFNSVLLDFIGAYEITVYYPKTEGDYTQGLVLCITCTN